jgi:TPR repeat protein
MTQIKHHYEKYYTIKRPTAALITALCLSFASTMAIADVSKGMAAYDKQDYAIALKEFKEFAEQGDAQAQFNLGQMYRQGQGVVKNMKTAYFWWLIASANGYDTKTVIEIAEKELSSAQKQAAQDDATNWRPKQ